MFCIAMVQFGFIIVRVYYDKNTLEKILYFHLYLNVNMLMIGMMKLGKRFSTKTLRRWIYFIPYCYVCFGGLWICHVLIFNGEEQCGGCKETWCPMHSIGYRVSVYLQLFQLCISTLWAIWWAVTACLDQLHQ